MVYMPIKSAMPNDHSKFPIPFYARLVSFNIRSILSNRANTTEFVISSYARFNILYSGKISRTINFAVFEDFTTTLKINSSKSYNNIESYDSL